MKRETAAELEQRMHNARHSGAKRKQTPNVYDPAVSLDRLRSIFADLDRRHAE